MRVLVTGGAGYIGSHTTLALLQAGIEVVVLDNLCNSSARSLERVAEIAGRAPTFICGDVRDRVQLDRLFAGHAIDAVLHFAGLKAVGESVTDPLRYYDTNVCGTIALCQAMQAAGVFTLVFSSSATVYGDPSRIPIQELHPVGQPTNPYGRSKLMAEQVLEDLAAAQASWRVALLRYFNPVGAHESGLIGEDPSGIPNNLLPYIAQVAVGKLAELTVFGDDYPTPDGTGVRDYIHVEDLATAHSKAVDHLNAGRDSIALNLGTGRGVSVMEIIRATETEHGRPVPHEFVDRRPGDPATVYADSRLANQVLGWTTTKGINEIVRDAYGWHRAARV
jgi:UDP-glucose 4-epimerase